MGFWKVEERQTFRIHAFARTVWHPIYSVGGGVERSWAAWQTPGAVLRHVQPRAASQQDDDAPSIRAPLILQ